MRQLADSYAKWSPLLSVVLLLIALSPVKAAPYRPMVPSETELQELLLLRHLPREGQLPALRALSRPKQLRWIQMIRKYDPALDYRANRGTHDREWQELLALNDTETAQWLIDQFPPTKSTPVGYLQVMAEWHTPQGIAVLAQRTFSDEPYEVRGSDMLWEPDSFAAAGVLLERMLPNMTALPMPVRNWAGKMHKALSTAFRGLWDAGGDTHEVSKLADHTLYPRTREIAQLWWRANEKAIMEERWQDVKPGETYDTHEYRGLLAQLAALRADGVSKPRGSAPSVATSNDATKPITGSAEYMPWASIGAAIAIIAGWLALRLRSRAGGGSED
jgi:hypothetical protein